MKSEALAASKNVYMVERSISWHGYSDDASYVASVKVMRNYVSFVLDGSEYCFTAQHCAEVTKNLVKMLLIHSGLGIYKGSAVSVLRLETLASWFRLFNAQTSSAERDFLQTYESGSKGFEFCASGSFRHPEVQYRESVYYKLVICLDDDLNLPCLGIEDRSFTLSFEEAFWLVEQLWIAGLLVAQTEQAT